MEYKNYLADMLFAVMERLKVYEIDSTFTIDGVDADDPRCLIVNSPFKTLYCVDFSGPSNTPFYITEESFEKIARYCKGDKAGFFVWALLKKGLFQKNICFTFSKTVAEMFARYSGGRVLEANETINILYDFFLDNDYQVKDRRLIRRVVPSKQINFEKISSIFNTFIKEAIFGAFERFSVFQSYEQIESDQPFRIHELFQKDFTGAIWTYVSFNKKLVLNDIDKKIGHTLLLGLHKKFKKLRDDYEVDNVTLGVVNSVLFLKDNNNSDLAADIGSYMRMSYVNKTMQIKKLLKKTPLLSRDTSYDRLVDLKFFKNYFCVAHKAETDVADIYGKDIMGGFINYGLSKPVYYETNTRPHFLIIGPTGSGKTTAVNKFISLMADVDYKTNTAKRLKAKNFRLFDIKKSMQKITDVLLKNPANDAKFIETNLNTFRYNLVNIDFDPKKPREKRILDRNDLNYAVALISIVYETMSSSKEKGISAEEKGILIEAIEYVYREQKYKHHVLELHELNPVLYQKLLSIGYRDTSVLTEVKEPEYEFLHTPILADVLKHLALRFADRQNTDTQKKYYETLISKLEAIQKIVYFAGFDNFDFKRGDYLHYDLDGIKNVAEFVPIFISLFSKVYKNDRHIQDQLIEARKARPEIVYIFEEAHNFFNVPSFKDILSTLVMEARSYGIAIGFVTQRPDHIPPAVFSQIETKFIVFPGGNDKQMLINSLSDVVKSISHGEKGEGSSNTLTPELMQLLNDTDKHGIVAWYEHGAFSFQLMLSPEELELFDTRGVTISEEEAV